jgi:hypothetical protein
MPAQAVLSFFVDDDVPHILCDPQRADAPQNKNSNESNN